MLVKTYAILLVPYFTGSSCSYYKFHVENSAATNQDCYTKIVYKMLIYGFKHFCTLWNYYQSCGYYLVKYHLLRFGTSIARVWMSRWEVGRGTQGRSFKSYDITQCLQMVTIIMYSKLKRTVVLHGREAQIFGLVTVNIVWLPLNVVMGWANKVVCQAN